MMLAGFAEAFTPVMVGFAVLGIFWGVAVLGLHRRV
jgi:hypothetical protein